jgi:hypothetical protein
MSSCCRAQQKDPNLEFFELVEKLTFALANRTEEDLKADRDSNIRWSKYQALQRQLWDMETMVGKEL